MGHFSARNFIGLFGSRCRRTGAGCFGPSRLWLSCLAAIGFWSVADAQIYYLNYNFTNGQTVSTCSGTFYDSGGSGGTYGNYEDYTVTFTSSTGRPISLTFFAFDVQGGTNCDQDKLMIYNGPNTSSSLIGSYCGSTSPGTVTASGTSLTLRFISNGATVGWGWGATIACLNPSLSGCSSFSNLQFSSPTMIYDAAGMVGDQWRFSSVLLGYDALVEILATYNVNYINTIDNDLQPAGYSGSWSPEINIDPVVGYESYVDFKITTVWAGTSTPANLPSPTRVTSVDVDSDAPTGQPYQLREIHRHMNPNGYILNNPTDLSIESALPYQTVLGSIYNYSGVSFDDKVKVAFYYAGANNTFNIRLGVRTYNQNYAPGAQTRLFAVLFDPCIAFSNPTVNPLTPIITGPSPVCTAGANATYSTTAVFTAYTWSVTGGNILSGQGTQNIVVDWTTAGNQVVYVTTTDGNGVVVSNSFPVSVGAPPTITASNTGPYCAGATIQLYSWPSGGSAPYTYSWNGAASFTSAVQNPTRPFSTTAMAGTYFILITDASTCTAVANTTVSVTAAPAVTADANIPCLGQSLALTGTASGGATPYTYQWTGPLGFTSTALSPPSFLALFAGFAGTYTLTVTSASGCASSASKVVSITSPPPRPCPISF